MEYLPNMSFTLPDREYQYLTGIRRKDYKTVAAVNTASLAPAISVNYWALSSNRLRITKTYSRNFHWFRLQNKSTNKHNKHNSPWTWCG